MKKSAKIAFRLGAKEIQLQIWGDEPERLLEVGRRLAAIDPRVMVKVTVDITGILLAKLLIDESAKVTLTALYFAQQAVTAIAIVAKYAVPFLGRMTDGGLNGLEAVKNAGKMSI